MDIHDLERQSFYIDGEWVAPDSTDLIEVDNPSTGDLLGTVPSAGDADIERAVTAARRAFHDPGGWRYLAAGERAAVAEAWADAIEERQAAFDWLGAVEVGRPIGSHGSHATRAAEILRYYASLARATGAGDTRALPEGQGGPRLSSLVRREPVGVVAAIVPYNAVLVLAMQKIAPAIVMGCTVVVKGPPQAPYDLYMVAEAAAAAGVPEGVFNVVAGGASAGEALVKHPGVDKVAFTGSTAAGRAIAEVCGALLRPVTLELGGKSAAVLLEDADLDAFRRSLGFLAFGFAGQLCFLNSRILAPRSQYEAVVELVKDFAANLRIGDASDAATTLGPVISRAHRDNVLRMIDAGVKEGARVATGGGIPAGRGRGWFVEPTVLCDVQTHMRVSQDEIFGPVVCVMSYETEDQAVAIANDSQYGLAGSVWTKDVTRGVDVAKRIDTGTIGINGYGFNSAAPFGGRKASGVGIELGPEGLDEYGCYQSIHLAA